MRRWSRHSRRTVPTHRSQTALALGARIGEWMVRTPSEWNTSSEEPPYFESRSWIRNRTPSRRSSMARFLACCVTQPESGMGRDACHVDPPGGELDEEQDVE